MKNLVLIGLLLPLGVLLKAQNYGDLVKIKHVLTNTNLHSHDIAYGHPQSSGQQQVTAFRGSDDNDYWIIKPEHGNNNGSGSIQHGAVIRLEHYVTRRNLHSHAGIPSPVSGQQEVTCFGDNGNGDSNDNWRIEIEGGGTWSTNKRVRLIHANTNHALHSHAGFSHPNWTHNQQEITGFGGRDDNDLWTMIEVKQNPTKNISLKNLGTIAIKKATAPAPIKGTNLRVITQCGGDDLRDYNTAYLIINFNNNLFSREYLLYRGLRPNQSINQTISLDQEINLADVRSISIRHDGTPANRGNPFSLLDRYDDWDLVALQVTLIKNDGNEVNIYSNVLDSGVSDKIPLRFTMDKRIGEFMKQK